MVDVLAQVWPVLALTALVLYAPIWRQRQLLHAHRDYSHERTEVGRDR